MPQSIADGALSWQRLAVVNAHPRDARISFEEESHTYTIDGTREGWTSCTTFIHTFFEDFDADAVIAKMMRGKSWKTSEYFGMSAEAIKAQWAASANEASTAGTRMHLDIEHWYNADPVGNLATDSYEHQPGPEWDYFQAFERKWRIPQGFVPFRTEWLVFKEDIRLAGSIDMVYKKPNGYFAIYDWKRAKKIKYDNPWQSGKEPIEHLPDTNYWHYSIQLNIYRTILEELYGAVVDELALVILHPNNPSFQIVKVNRMEVEIEAMFEVRKERVAAATAATRATVATAATAAKKKL